MGIEIMPFKSIISEIRNFTLLIHVVNTAVHSSRKKCNRSSGLTELAWSNRFYNTQRRLARSTSFDDRDYHRKRCNASTRCAMLCRRCSEDICPVSSVHSQNIVLRPETYKIHNRCMPLYGLRNCAGKSVHNFTRCQHLLVLF